MQMTSAWMRGGEWRWSGGEQVAAALVPERALAWFIESRRREHSVALQQWRRDGTGSNRRSHDLLAR